MGYQSIINIKVDIKHKFPLLTLLDKHEIHIDQAWEDEHYFSLALYDRKWYSSYPEVTAVNDFIQNFDEEGGLIAISEDELIKTQGSPYSVNMYAYAVVDNLELDQTKTDSLEIKNFKEYQKLHPEDFI